jgi:hypothetical protein
MHRKTRIVTIGLIAFVVLFAARFTYELVQSSESTDYGYAFPVGDFDEMQQMNAPSSSLARKNYASAKIVIAQPSAQQTVEQKYERVSTIDTRTANWDADVDRLKTAIDAVEAMIQKENASGLEGGRVLALSLGVVPSVFDSAVESFQAVGELFSISTTKNDRTADFLALEARRLSLEKTRDGLSALRNSGAALADRISLETRILEIEGQIQELGVSLGDFSELNSFCTINITLREKTGQSLLPRLVSAAFNALGWSVAVFAGSVFSILCLFGLASLGFKLYDRFKTA